MQSDRKPALAKERSCGLHKWLIGAVVLAPLVWQCLVWRGFPYYSGGGRQASLSLSPSASPSSSPSSSAPSPSCPPCPNCPPAFTPSGKSSTEEALTSSLLVNDTKDAGAPVLDFYVRTWKGDGHWLIFMLRSIEAHVPRTAYRDIIVTYNRKEDEFFRSYLPQIPLPLKLIPEDDVYFREGANNGSYYSQMYSKFLPWRLSDADFFIHIDSDCVFTQQVSRLDFLDKQGRVYVKRVEYAKLNEAFRRWQAGAERLVNESVPMETMTGVPFVFPREAYQGLIEHVERQHEKPFLETMKSLKDFNEFTPLGHYLIHHMPGRWVDNNNKSAKVMQQVSWRGFTPEAAAACEAAIRAGN